MSIIKPQKSLAVKKMSAGYFSYFEQYGGVREFYLSDTQGRSVLKSKPKPVLVEYSIFTISLIAAVPHTIFFTDGFISIALFFLYSVLLAYGVKMIVNGRRVNRDIYEAGQELALQYEPKNLWNKNFPTKGEKGELITAVLAARRLYDILSRSTSVPVNLSARDPYISHLIDEIISSKEGDIHEYIYHEVNHFCESALMYGEFYNPIIGINTVPADLT